MPSPASNVTGRTSERPVLLIQSRHVAISNLAQQKLLQFIHRFFVPSDILNPSWRVCKIECYHNSCYLCSSAARTLCSAVGNPQMQIRSSVHPPFSLQDCTHARASWLPGARRLRKSEFSSASTSGGVVGGQRRRVHTKFWRRASQASDDGGAAAYPLSQGADTDII